MPAAPNADANAAKAARLEKRKARMAMGGKMEGKERVRVRKERGELDRPFWLHAVFISYRLCRRFYEEKKC